MFKKNPILNYESASLSYENLIQPAKNFIPRWYKKIPPFNENFLFNIEKEKKSRLKGCSPFLDSFTIGYIVTLPYDLHVRNNDGEPYLSWPADIENPPGWRSTLSDKNLVPLGHYTLEYLWHLNVALSVPKGYSFILTHPFNRHDLPFTTLTGIIDGGFVASAYGNVPFFIKNNFEGIIPQGTPIAQIIPFRQENWKSQVFKGLVNLGKITSMKSDLIFFGWYKKTFWVNKKYE